MRARKTTRRSWVGTLFLVVGVLLITGGGVFGSLWAAGYIQFGPQEPSREGQIAFPATAQPIPAFTRISREHLINPQTNDLHVIWLPEHLVSEKMIRDLGQLIGRVAAHDINPNAVLTESNLMPKGTRPGLTAGVPPGKRSMTLDASRVPGLESLRRGDVFDLLTALPVRDETEPDSNVEYGVLLGGIKPPDMRAGRLQRQSGVKVLVRGGVMVAHTKGKEQSTEGGAALVVPPAGNRRSQQLSVDATIAIDPQEVMPLTEALGLDVPIYCVAHSGHPDNPAEESFPELDLAGLVAVPATIRPIKAFSRITQADLADPVTGKLNVYYFSQEQIAADWLTEFDEIVGRVVATDVDAGFIFSESQLMPPGTPEGLAAAIPHDKVGLAVETGRIEGLDELKAGDRFDVLSTLPQSMASQGPPQMDWATTMGGQPPAEDEEIYQQLRTGLRIVVRDALKLIDEESGDKTVIAVGAEEVTSLSQMLGREDVALQVIARPVQKPRSPPIPSDQMAKSAGASSKRVGFVSHEDDRLTTKLRVQALTGADAIEGKVRVPLVARPVKAFQKLAVEDFINPTTGKANEIELSQSQLHEPAWRNSITDIKHLLDRVVAMDIAAGYPIKSDELLPEGTRPGVVGGIPPGMVAFSLSSLKVQGLSELKVGDEFLLVAARPFRVNDLGDGVQWSLRGGNLQEQTAGIGGLFEQAQVKTILGGGRLLFASERENQTIREKSSKVETQQLLSPDGSLVTSTRTEPIVESYEVAAQNFVVALKPRDVASLSEAISTGTSIHAVLKTGNAQVSKVSPVISENQPLSNAHFIEHIRGNERKRELWLRNRK